MSKKAIVLTSLLTLLFAFSLFAIERSDIPDKYKWNPSHIYANLDDWQKDFDYLSSQVEVVAGYKGKFAGENAVSPAKDMLEFQLLTDELWGMAERLYVYIMYNYHTDLTNGEWGGKIQQLQMLFVNFGEKLAWVDPEILQIPQETLHGWIDAEPALEPYRKQFDDLYASQEHVLSEDQEAILALAGNITGTASDVYGKFMDADLRYGYITDSAGDSIEVTRAGWVAWRSNQDRQIREDYFKTVWGKYQEFSTMQAALMNGMIKKDIFLSKARNYDNTLQRMLKGNFIPEQVYINLVETTRNNCAPLHKYNEIRKRMLGVENYRHWDYYVSIIDEPEERLTWEDGVDIVVKAMAPLGKQFVADITYGLNTENGWVDPFTHTGKRNGAYSSSAYQVHPYMLYNFDYEKGLTLNDVSTIAHEVGHSMHTFYSEKNQPYSNRDYATFNAEVASTVNEAIMTLEMLEKARAEYKKFKKYGAKKYDKPKHAEKRESYLKAKNKLMALLESNIDNIRQTFYRQTMFATWEWEAHKMGEEGMPLTKESLCGLYAGLLKEFHGPAAEYEDLSSYSWIYIPHFYRGYYVYSYATSYAAAVALAKDIRAEYKGDKSKKGATERYLNYLGSGSSKHPVELLADAGVDMNTPAPIESLIAQFSEWVDELDALTLE